MHWSVCLGYDETGATTLQTGKVVGNKYEHVAERMKSRPQIAIPSNKVRCKEIITLHYKITITLSRYHAAISNSNKEREMRTVSERREHTW